MPNASAGVDAGQMRNRAGAPHIVEAVQITVAQNRRLPLIAQDALGTLRCPHFGNVEPAAVRLQGQQHRTMIFAGREKDAAVDRERRGDIAVKIGEERITPQFGTRPGIETQASFAVKDRHHVAVGDLQYNRR